MSNFRRRLMQSIKKKEYTELEYIELTGTQYIKTGVLTSKKLKCECTFSTNTPQRVLFGARKSPTSDGLISGYFETNPTLSAFVAYGGASSRFSTTITCTDNNVHTITLSDTEYTIDNEEQTIDNRGTFTNFYEIYLGTWNNAGVGDIRMHIGKIYSFKIYDNNVLIRDFIPVLDKDYECCMYDKVNKKFYYNAGTGSFYSAY